MEKHHNGAVSLFLLVLAFSAASDAAAARVNLWDLEIRMPTDHVEDESDEVGTRWAVLVAGSSGFGNYRHQADICHAYQLLKKGGLKEENIVVFMFDDIANNPYNPRPGVIINHPNGEDVYAGVPKDYTGEAVNANNLYAVLLGDNNGVKGGSGKVVDSKPNDRIFIYYSDHGGPGVLGMPDMAFIFAGDFIDVLKKKHDAGTYKEMVIYVEACESGSVFEGLMAEDMNVYVTTASNAEESSWGTYCPGMDPPPPPGYVTCLGDLYSVAWMEDSEVHNLKKETIEQQYNAVKDRTSNYNTYNIGSHVMEYGNKSMKAEKLYLYQGFDPANAKEGQNALPRYSRMGVVNQRDADLLFLWHSYERLKDGSPKKNELLEEITHVVAHRAHVDSSIKLIGNLLFGSARGHSVLKTVRPSGRALVDDWDCLKAMVQVFESECGSLTQYGMKHMRAFANICNKGISKEAMKEACQEACGRSLSGSSNLFVRGYST